MFNWSGKETPIVNQLLLIKMIIYPNLIVTLFDEGAKSYEE
jgi:hypothetical protein